MIKKILIASVIISQLAISCSKDKPEQPSDKVEDILKQPYSKLTPAEQKVKLEAEANEMLTQMEKTKSSGAIEAIQNLEKLSDIDEVDVLGGKNDNGVEDILNIADAYGIYTWDNAKKVWNKTASTTDLKFVFPAKINGKTNNATLSANSVSTDKKVTSAKATLTIDGTQAATFAFNAKYSKGNSVPDEASFKMELKDGYSWEMSGNKGTGNTTAKAVFTYNGKNLLEFSAGSTADIDGLLNNDPLGQYKGKANGLIRIMDNFAIVADVDLETAASDTKALEKSLVKPSEPSNRRDSKSDYKAYYTAVNEYNKKISEGNAANLNKNSKLALVSKKDGTKIADIIYNSEESNSYPMHLPRWYYQDGGFWGSDSQGELFTVQDFDEVQYLKFGDGTKVKPSVYFSEVFEDLEDKFNDFAKSFDR